MSSNVILKKLSWSLSLAGLIPFAGLASVIVLEHPYALLAHQALIAYAMAILSFLGAIHWGAVLQRGRNDDPAISVSALVWGVLPSLWAWATIFFAAHQQPLWLIVGLLIALGVDTLFYPRHGLAGWMMPIRLVATVGAATSLLLAALHFKL
jgi:Protein of unknown function (DUF3429)